MGRKREAKVRAYEVVNKTIHDKNNVGIFFDDDGEKARRQAFEVNAKSESRYLGFANVEVHRSGHGLALSGKGFPEQHVTEDHPSWPYICQKYAPLLEHIEREMRDDED